MQRRLYCTGAAQPPIYTAARRGLNALLDRSQPSPQPLRGDVALSLCKYSEVESWARTQPPSVSAWLRMNKFNSTSNGHSICAFPGDDGQLRGAVLGFADNTPEPALQWHAAALAQARAVRFAEASSAKR